MTASDDAPGCNVAEAVLSLCDASSSDFQGLLLTILRLVGRADLISAARRTRDSHTSNDYDIRHVAGTPLDWK